MRYLARAELSFRWTVRNGSVHLLTLTVSLHDISDRYQAKFPVYSNNKAKNHNPTSATQPEHCIFDL
ncbi:Uncharacterized protein HZ326_21242 [Fusarium oxysporum f. sp. albedinis]|nr:Uncharacterized protein HZ326_21242 [Fusarium oxysporum f. sp. albedinis]